MISFSSNDGSVGRGLRLMRTYQRMNLRTQRVILSMHDAKGIMSVVVSKILPDLSEDIGKAWEKECEYSFDIKCDGEIVYSSWDLYYERV